MSPRIIALTGYAGSGKDTVANHLVAEYGFVHVKCADGLKYLLEDQFGISYADQNDPEKKDLVVIEYGMSVREIQDRIGEAFRDINPAHWAMRAVRQIDAYLALPPDPEFGEVRVVLSDLRLPPEYDSLCSRAAIIWRLVKPGLKPRHMDRYVDSFGYHRSITAKDVPDLLSQVDGLMGEF